METRMILTCPCLLYVKSLYVLEIKMDQLCQIYLRKVCRRRRRIELSHTREDIRKSRNFAFTQVRPQNNINHRILFVLTNSH